MGDVRFNAPLRRVRGADNPAATIRSLCSEDVIAALAAVPPEREPYLTNVLATEAQNRARKHETVIRTMAEGVCAIDAGGRVTLVNPAAEAMLGWPEQELLRRKLHDVVHGHADAEGLRDVEACLCLDVLETGRTIRREDATFTRRDGTPFPVAFTAAPVIREGDIEGAVIVFRDITARQRAEEALRKSEARYRLLADHASDMIASYGTDGIARYVSPACRAVLGYEPEELVGQSAYEIIHPDDAERVREKHRELLESDEMLTITARLRHRDGHYIWVESTGRAMRDPEMGEVTELITVTRDVTDRKRARDEAERMRRRNELILASVGEGIYGIDPDGRTTFVNPAAANMLGYAPRELVGVNLHELIHHHKPDGSPYPRGACPMFATAREGVIHRVQEEVFWRKDGTSFPVGYVSTPVRTEDGRIEGAVIAFRDLTGQKEVEEARAEAAQTTADRVHAERMNDLAKASRKLAEAGFDMARALEVAPRAVAELTHGACFIRLLSEDGKWLIPAGLADPDPERLEGLRRVFAAGAMPADASVHGDVLQSGRVREIEVDDPAFRAGVPDHYVEALRNMGVPRFLLVPLQLRDRKLGTVGFCTAEASKRPVAEEERIFLQDVADRIAMTLENARLHEAERAARRKAEKATTTIRRMLDQMSDASDELLRDAEQAARRVEEFQLPP